MALLGAGLSLVAGLFAQGVTEKPKRLGLVLSGGGAKGLAHIGVLKVLEEEGLRPDVITGTSMGSLIGGLYACGYSAAQIEAIVLDIHWDDVLTNKIPLDRIAIEEKPFYGRFLLELPFNGLKPSIPSGLIRGQKIDELIRRLTLPYHGTTNFDSLPIPFACVATDVGRGQAVLQRHGLLADALRASMSIPTIFSPPVRDTMLLVDGGTLRNFPVSDAKDMGADLVIGVQVGDGLVAAEYPYVLPIWGEQATKAGFDLPYSAGISTQYFGQRSDLIIENLMVGFNGNEMHDLDGIIRFDRAKAQSDGISFRPDVWVFPFLNVYAILGKSAASTDVGYSLWLPDSTGVDQKLASFGTKVDFTANTFGFGLTPTVGVGGGFLALDMNMTWTDVPQLDKPAFAFVFGPRLGKSFKMKKPGSSAQLWVGGFRFKINTGTTGSIPLADALPVDQWQSGVDQGQAQVAELDQQVEAWWSSLSPLEQANPINAAKYNSANAVLDRTAGFLNDAESAVANAESSSVEYSIDKRPDDMWNFIMGGQYQFNKHWMVRAEFGFLSSRTQLIAGLQYRFGL